MFDSDSKQIDYVTLREKTAFVWHGFINSIKPGQLYGYRVDGPVGPRSMGIASIFHKLLVDPYAKALSGEVDWQQPIFPYDVAAGDPLKMDTEDSVDGVPKCVVIDGRFDWGDDCKPQNSSSRFRDL